MGLECRFSTPRLRVEPWALYYAGAGEEGAKDNFAGEVVNLMLPEVTTYLPPGWQGPFDFPRAQRWVQELDEACEAVLVVDVAKQTPIGLLFLFADDDGDEPTTHLHLRIGYLLHPSSWSKGFGSELIRGLVAWSRSNERVCSLTGGVARDNVASRRVLEKSGFVASSNQDQQPDEVFFELDTSV